MPSSWFFLCLILSFISPGRALPDDSIRRVTSLSNHSFMQTLVSSFQQLFTHISQGTLSRGELVQLVAFSSIFPCLWYLQRKRKFIGGSSEPIDRDSMSNGSGRRKININETEDVDPGLLKKHSEIRSFTTSQFTYPALRIFFSRHPQANRLPTTPAPLPLLVFIHGLGGSTHQFHSLLTTFVNLANVLAVDLPGCGLSSFAPASWDAYTTDALAELLGIIIEEYREKDKDQGVVLIGHSMGCSLAAILASKTSGHNALSENVMGLIAICPKAGPPTEEQTNTFRKLLWVPNLIFDTWRKWDQRGGINSSSVTRFVGADADVETKKLQNKFNSQSRTAVWRRMASGSLPVYSGGVAKGGLPGREVWAGLDCPVFLVAGEVDNVTKPSELVEIANYLGESHPVQIKLDEESQPIIDAAAPVDVTNTTSDAPENLTDAVPPSKTEANPDTLEDSHDDPSTPNEELSFIPHQPTRPRRVLKTTILPAPASHALLYMPSTVRILAGLVSDFLQSQVSPRLSLGWQLQFLSTSGKWDVKNLAKWQAVNPVSEPIVGIFRAMKTLREVDELHSPETFVRDWGAEIKDIVDISHESPVYDPRGLEKGGIRYHKFPTVSKIPPTGEEVSLFVLLIDRLREEQILHSDKQKCLIGVHCHYGFNRTGYFIVCYMIERCGYTVQGAIDEFAKRRPKGIKHAHFMDQLFVRYCVGLKTAPTL